MRLFKFVLELSKNVRWSIRQSNVGQKQFQNVSIGAFHTDIIQIWFKMRLSVNVLVLHMVIHYCLFLLPGFDLVRS
jgi:hypothetical protein